MSSKQQQAKSKALEDRYRQKEKEETSSNSSSGDEEDTEVEDDGEEASDESTTIANEEKKTPGTVKLATTTSSKQRRSTRRSGRTTAAAATSSNILVSPKNVPKRRSNNKQQTKAKEKPSKKKLSKSATIDAGSIDCSFGQVARSVYHYDLRKCDQEFLEHLFTALPQIKTIWDRIGFNSATQQERLEKFFAKMTEFVDGIVDEEEYLEERILESIEELRSSLQTLCFDLQIRYDDLKSAREGNTMTILDLDKCLRAETERLNAEKRKRLDDFKQLSAIESELCDKLVMKKTELRLNIPSESDINALRARCKELEKLKVKRRAEMEKIKEECVMLSDDLELSRSDTFAELLLLESVDEMSLGEEDIQKAIDFRDELVRKNREAVNEILSLRVKIKELWNKLKISNPDVSDVMEAAGELGEHQTSSIKKRTLISELHREHDRCVQIKMENMQKFIEAIRADIRELCVKMYFGDKEMKKLSRELLSLQDYTEHLLQQHERILEDMKFRYDENITLYEKVGAWIKLWNEFMQFEEASKDPQRFKQRGYNSLDEERKRKVFQNQLPKLEQELNALTTEYREMNGGNEFTVYGMSFPDYVHTRRVDYEDSKENERKEKQMMRDTIKKNETRFGSKPVTPLALRNKRKLGGMQDSHLPNTPGAAYRSKIQRTDIMPTTPSSRVVNVARGLHNTPGNNGTTINVGTKMVASRAIGNPKRKSRTPGKNKTRRSRILNQSRLAAAVAAAASTTAQNQLSTGGGDTTLKTSTIATSSTTSLFQSTLSSSTATTTSTANLTTQSSASMKLRFNKQQQQCPPLSASSKFASTNNLTSMGRMTSTASNTFIEEENTDLVEITAVSSVSSAMNKYKSTATTTRNDPAYVTQAAAAKITEMYGKSTTAVATMNSASCDSQKTCEIGYAEFSRDLPRSKFGQDATNLISATGKVSQLPTRSQLPRTTKK